jgi:Xaa-Pro dipeptidase
VASSAPSRAEQIRKFLQLNNLRAWIAWRPDELVMLSEYFPCWGASLLLYFVDRDPVLFVPQLESRDQIPSALRVREYPWGDLKCPDPFAVLVSAIGDELSRANLKAEQVGLNPSAARSSLPMMAAEQIPFPEDFASQLSTLAAKPDSQHRAAFRDLYLRKAPKEIEAIRLANQVAGVGLQAFFDHLKPGTAETAIAGSVESAIHQQTGRDGILYARAWAMVQSGPHSADGGTFNRSSARKLQNGDLVLIELATCVNGYWSDLTRTAAVGQLETGVEEVLRVATKAQQRALDAVRPGVAAGEIDALARDFIAAHGFSSFFKHGTGHHVGFRYHDPGFGIVPGESAKLEPAMVVTIEPGVYIPDRRAGARIEDNVLVTQSGHETLSRREERSPT